MFTSSKIALVTGAGSGIGRATAIALSQAGYFVVLVGRRLEPLLETVSLLKGSEQSMVVPTDVTSPESVAALFIRIKEKCGHLDVLFNNAGTNFPGIPFEELSYEKWTSVVNVNLTGMFLCAQGAFRLMKEQTPQGGRIINNGSISAHAPRPDSAAYTATKHGVTGLTKSISLDGRKYGIACGQIDIGNAHTELSQRMAKGVKQANGEVVVEAMMDVSQVANSVVYMAGVPLDTNVQFITVMATTMPFVGRG